MPRQGGPRQTKARQGLYLLRARKSGAVGDNLQVCKECVGRDSCSSLSSGHPRPRSTRAAESVPASKASQCWQATAAASWPCQPRWKSLLMQQLPPCSLHHVSAERKRLPETRKKTRAAVLRRHTSSHAHSPTSSPRPGYRTRASRHACIVPCGLLHQGWPPVAGVTHGTADKRGERTGKSSAAPQCLAQINGVKKSRHASWPLGLAAKRSDRGRRRRTH